MSQFTALIKVMLKSGFRGTGKEKKGRNTGSVGMTIFAVAIVVLCIGGLCLMFGVMFGLMSGGTGGEAAVFTLALTVIESFLLLFAVIYLLATMYFSRENEFLLGLPLKSGTIFLAKLFSVYIYLLAFGGVALLAFGIPFGVTAGLSARFYVLLLPACLLVPLAPIFVGTLLSFPLMYVVSFFRRSRLLTTVLVVLGVALFAGIYIGVYTNMDFTSGEESGGQGQETEAFPSLPEATVESMDSATRFIFFNRCFANLGIESNNVALDLLSLFGSYAAMAGLTYLMSASLYRRGMSMQLETGGEVVTRNRDLKANTPGRALLLKELRMAFRNPVLLFYSLLELVLPVVLMLIFSKQMENLVAASEMLPAELAGIVRTATLCMALFFGLVFACSMNYVALTAVSREGKNFYLMKLIPVPVQKQLEIKGLLAYVLPLASLLVIAVWMMCIGAVSILSGICFFLFTAILSYGFTFFQVGLDVKRPRLDYDNMTQMMQNNTNALICMGVNFLFSLAAIGLTVGAMFLQIPIQNQLVTEIILWAVLLAGAGVTSRLFRRSYLRDTFLRFDAIEH